MALEILIPNAAIRNLIREDKIHQIYSMMQTGQDKFGMQTFNQALATLVSQTPDHARGRDAAFVECRRAERTDRTWIGLNESYREQASPAAQPAEPAAHTPRDDRSAQRPPVR